MVLMSHVAKCQDKQLAASPVQAMHNYCTNTLALLTGHKCSNRVGEECNHPQGNHNMWKTVLIQRG